MAEDPFEEYLNWMSGYGYFFPVMLPPTPAYPYYGSFDSTSSPLPEGFKVFYSNAKYYPMFDGASYRVILDFGNGTIIFYPGGFFEMKDNVSYLGLQVYFNDELCFELKP